MKKAKTVVLIVLGAGLAVLIYQNWHFFAATQYLRINLGVDEYQSPEYPMAVYLLAFFLLGALAAYFSNLAQRFKARKVIKEQAEAIKTLRSGLEELKNRPSAGVPRPENVPDPEAAVEQ